jgi:glycosyltransferase involved in cell wall biosynthesis
MLTTGNHVPLVTVGLPVYNGERFVASAIDALLAQTYRDFVLIISDNASTDRTAAICQQYVQQDSRVCYHRNPHNIGLSANFNRVFALGTTRYFKWATADDYVSPEMLGDAVNVLEADPSVVLCYSKTTLVDVVSGAMQTYEDQLNLMQEDAAERFIAFLNNIGLSHQHQGVIRSEAIRRTAMLRDHVGSDINFLAELTLYGKFHELPRFQFFRRCHPESSSWNRASAAHQARRYHAAGVSRIRFNTWKKHLAYTRAILRSSCTPYQKARLLGVVARHAYWDKSDLSSEFVRDGFRWLS